MNSEELELSLRAEFESYLKGFLAKIQQDVSEFQRNFEAEFEKHKTQLDKAVRDLSTRFESDPDFDRAFTESITEHLRLARDEGATITAEAIGEAEKLKTENGPAVSYDRIRDAVNDITSQTSQAAILRSLIENAGEFAPRGAFFIARNDRFVGWKVFGKEGSVDESAVQAISLPMSADTLLSAAASSLATQEGNYTSHADDSEFLGPLGFDRPDRMVAIPLVARGRGVAVMYADYGMTGVSMNRDALETLVRVAGLAVELLAAANEMKSEPQPAKSYSGTNGTGQYERAAETSYAGVPAPAVANPEPPAPSAAFDAVEEYTGEVSFETEPAKAADDEVVTGFDTPVSASFMEESRGSAAEVTYFEPEAEIRFDTTVKVGDIDGTGRSEDSTSEWQTPSETVASVQQEPAAPSAEHYSGNGNGTSQQPVAAAEPESPQTARSRYSDRNVDLPVEVSDDAERRMHNRALRFARLLVSEIKLYNKEQVIEGRESNDLYDRLRDAIDRSREMYEKRVEPEVAAKFDYFHYELVNDLAEGKNERLGESYQAAGSRAIS